VCEVMDQERMEREMEKREMGRRGWLEREVRVLEDHESLVMVVRRRCRKRYNSGGDRGAGVYSCSG